ncbi:MAG: flagellar biosynthesis anti-sigma factor FlgM [Gracilibacteraceae bacterium]|jgi:anti-sigma28 factor (negative regulator of flagellin synthesis)|nr:flagellar biosynthesis anti-sigma factor FlgM [Gracilibacteraceae bacterium]
MKVEGLGTLYYQRKVSEHKGSPSGGKTATRQDQVTLSPDAQKVAEDARLETVRKQERLDGIKARVEGGTYSVPSEYVVDAILRRAGIGSGRI